MTSPNQILFGLGLTFEADGDAAHRNDDSLGWFGDIYDTGVGCDDTYPEFKGTESVSFNQNTDINSQIQPFVRSGIQIPPFSSPDIQYPVSRNEPPRSQSPYIQQQPVIKNESPKFPFNNSWSIQQQPFTKNYPTTYPFDNSWGTQQQPIIIQESPEFPFNNPWNSQQQHFDVVNDANGSQSLQDDLFSDQWDIPSPSDPFWSHFPPRPFQTQTSDGNSKHETSLGANNEYNPGFAGNVQIHQTQTSYVNQDLTHTTQPQRGNPTPISQGISSDTIDDQSALYPIQRYLAASSQQSHWPLQRAGDGGQRPVTNDAPILQRPAIKRLKANNGNAAPGPGKARSKDGNINPRKARRIELDPTQYYQPLTTTPRSWGTINPDGRHRFRYNGFGELKPGMTFTSDEMLEYLYGSFPRADNLKSNNPSLFIQCVPSDSNSRYPTTLSSKCRFTDCPVRARTIPSGHFRVAFDEQNNGNLDPYHCAGYVHLYCLERLCSFSCLAKYCNLVPDTRVLREGRNRMSITRDHSEFARLCMVYMEDSRHRDPHADGWEYLKTLCSLLTEEYLRLEARVRRATRERQGGNNIGAHRNDMEVYAWGQENKMMLRSMAARERPGKRKRRTGEEHEDGNDGYEYGE